MTDIPLPPIRIGYSYSVQLDFSAGFFDPAEGLRTRLRRFLGDTSAVTPTDTITGDSVTWELSEAQTATMPVGLWYAEGELYTLADPASKGEFLTDTRYVIPCNHGPSE